MQVVELEEIILVRYPCFVSIITESQHNDIYTAINANYVRVEPVINNQQFKK